MRKNEEGLPLMILSDHFEAAPFFCCCAAGFSLNGCFRAKA